MYDFDTPMEKIANTVATLMVITGLVIAAYTMYQLTQGTIPDLPQFALYYSMGTTAGMAVYVLHRR